MKTYVYQIGRLDTNMSEKTFKFKDSEPIKISLSSFAFKHFLTEKYSKEKEDKQEANPKNDIKDNVKNNVKVILAFPSSLPFNKYLISEKAGIEKDLKNLVEKILDENDRKSYLENPYKFFENHPHAKQADGFFVLHSIFTASKIDNFEGIIFKSTFEQITYEIFLDMIERVFLGNFKEDDGEKIELYIDISSGQNFYNSALVEAARSFTLFYKLANYNSQDKIETKIIFSDPILTEEGPYNIHVSYDINPAVFFKSPLNYEEFKDNKLCNKIFSINVFILNNIDIENYINELKIDAKKINYGNNKTIEVSKINEFKNNILVGKNTLNELVEIRESLIKKCREKIRPIFESFVLTYSSIKNGIPLFFYYIDIMPLNNIIDNIKILINFSKIILNKDWVDDFGYTMGINYKDLIKTFNLLAFYITFINIFNKKKIVKKDKVSYEELQAFYEDDKANNIFNIFRLEAVKLLVANELKGYSLIRKDIDNKSTLDRVKNEWHKLFEAMPYYKDEESNNEAINTRNFLAHAGFERTITEVKKEGNIVYFRYMSNKIGDIKNILIKDFE